MWYLELFELLVVGNGEGVVIRREAERQPAHQTVHHLSELCEESGAENRRQTRSQIAGDSIAGEATLQYL